MCVYTYMYIIMKYNILQYFYSKLQDAMKLKFAPFFSF